MSAGSVSCAHIICLIPAHKDVALLGHAFARRSGWCSAIRLASQAAISLFRCVDRQADDGLKSIRPLEGPAPSLGSLRRGAVRKIPLAIHSGRRGHPFVGKGQNGAPKNRPNRPSAEQSRPAGLSNAWQRNRSWALGAFMRGWLRTWRGPSIFPL